MKKVLFIFLALIFFIPSYSFAQVVAQLNGTLGTLEADKTSGIANGSDQIVLTVRGQSSTSCWATGFTDSEDRYRVEVIQGSAIISNTRLTYRETISVPNGYDAELGCNTYLQTLAYNPVTVKSNTPGVILMKFYNNIFGTQDSDTMRTFNLSFADPRINAPAVSNNSSQGNTTTVQSPAPDSATIQTTTSTPSSSNEITVAQDDGFVTQNLPNPLESTVLRLITKFFGAIVIVLTLYIVSLIITLMGMWLVFYKAGYPGWASIIPFYNSFVLVKLSGKPTWWFFLLLSGLIPFVGFLVTLVTSFLLSIEVGKRFNKTSLFSIFALWLFPFIGYPILGFGQDQYDSISTDGSTVQ